MFKNLFKYRLYNKGLKFKYKLMEWKLAFKFFSFLRKVFSSFLPKWLNKDKIKLFFLKKKQKKHLYISFSYIGNTTFSIQVFNSHLGNRIFNLVDFNI